MFLLDGNKNHDPCLRVQDHCQNANLRTLCIYTRDNAYKYDLLIDI